MKNRHYQPTLRNHYLRPKIAQNTQLSNFFMNNTDPSNIDMDDLNINNVLINPNAVHNSTAVFLDQFLAPLRSRQLGRVSRIDQIRQHNRTRERATKTKFVAARSDTRKQGQSNSLRR